MKQSILITGGCGFVGSNLAVKFKLKYPTYKIFCFDNLKRRGSELNIPRLKNQGIKFIHGDVRNYKDLDQIQNVTTIIDASADPAVTAGITNSLDYVINTNLLGTINCLNKAVKNKASFIFLSTSRVYPIKLLKKIKFKVLKNKFKIGNNQTLNGVSEKGISENFPLAGSRSFYGATKLASELLIIEYAEFLKLKAVILRCSSIAGPFQFGKVEQGFVTLWVANHLWNKTLTYQSFGGQGKQIRDILNIMDLFKLIDWQIHNINKVSGQTFNAGGGLKNSLSLQELTLLCQQTTNKKAKIKKDPSEKQADIPIYITDNTKVTKKTGWKPKTSPKQTVKEIYDWLVKDEGRLKEIFNN